MTLDEAIKHCLETAEQLEERANAPYKCEDSELQDNACRECAADHRQLAEWLTELQELELQIKAPRLGSIEEYHYELARCKAAFWSCNKRCMDAEEQYRRKADELRKAHEQIAEYKRLLKSAVDVQPINRWISCQDKMPEDNTSVLFVYVSENGIKSVHYGYHQTLKGLGSAWAKPSGGWQYADDDVTHWQSLPEPPKDGDFE